MASYEYSSVVDAPLSRVWAFFSRPSGLVDVSPSWLHLRVEAVRGPDGDPDPGSDELVEGSTVTASIRPFGVGPRRRWESEIVEREAGSDAAVFRDAMREGPFPRWEHTHRFRARSDGTEITDRVEYDLPGGAVGRVVGPVGVVGLEPLFRYRHRRARELLDGGSNEARVYRRA